MIYIGTLTEHRNNKQASRLLMKALDELNIKYTTDMTDNFEKSIVWNSLATKEADSKIKYLQSKSDVNYMYVDNDLSIPEGVNVITQFKDCKTQGHYFEISKLAVFHELWDKPIKNIKAIDYFHGGTFKDRRDYSPLMSCRSLLLCGDDSNWGNLNPDAVRLPTIRNMDYLYNIMSMCRFNTMVSDPEHNDVNTPTRFYETVFAGMDLIDFSTNEVYYGDVIREKTNKEKFKEEIKELIDGPYNN